MFKLGDKVIVNKKSPYYFLVNKTGIVCGFYKDKKSTALVYFKEWVGGHSGFDGTDGAASSFFKKNGITDYVMSCYFIDAEYLTLLSSQLEFDFNE
jgi:hypothetical protein